MNIKTITCHDVYNFGASLQAYALQTFLEEQGHKVEIIDYLPKYKHFYELFTADKNGYLGKMNKKIPFLEPVWALIQHRKWITDISKIRLFKYFKKNYLKCTQQSYKCIEDFRNNKPMADLFIAGSDQIWNIAFLNGLDPVYYCMFEHNPNKCISYAASFGISQIPEKHNNFVKKGLTNFRAISIREMSGVRLANSLGFTAINVLDPVFLLTKTQWKNIMKKVHTEKYLLVYDFANNDVRIEEIAIKIATERGLKIYSFNSNKSYINKILRKCGPIEFLEWIADADIIVSNSFHATAFSIIFEKDFFTIPLLGHENSSRMKDLLDLIGLSDRYLTTIKGIDTITHINYKNYMPKLKIEQEKSKKWLIDSIKQEGNEGTLV